MIRRNDLVKQFELVVKQEIINHNKAVSASNQLINSLKNELNSLSNSFKEKYRDDWNRELSFDKKIELIEKDIVLLRKEIADLSLISAKTSQDFDETKQSIKKELNDHISEEKSFEERLQYLDDRIHDLKKKISNLENFIRQESAELIRRFTKSLSNTKEEILSRPDGIALVKQELTKKLEEGKVEKDGLIRELDVLKKQNFIQDKQIENLYTLIERLTNKIATLL